MNHLVGRCFLFLILGLMSWMSSQSNAVEVPIDQYSESAVGLECEQISGVAKLKYFVLDVDQKMVYEWANEGWRSQSLNRVTADEVEWNYWQVFSYVLNRKNLNLRQFGFANYRCVLRPISEIPERVNLAYEGNKI